MTIDKAVAWLATAAFVVLAFLALVAGITAVFEAIPCLLLGRCG